MPQKTRRQKIRAASKPVNVPQVSKPMAPASAPTNAVENRQVTTTLSPAPQATFDYTYVYRDLRRIGLLALSFFVILVALSFVLPQFYR